MQALHIYAGPKARLHLQNHGLLPQHVGVIPGAAGGPKGLLLGPLDRFIFGHWLPQSTQPVDLVGASIGAWRMATACLDAPVQALAQLERAYIAQHYEPLPGHKRVSAQQVSDAFGRNLQAFYGGRVAQALHHPRYRLHIVTSRGRHVLRREHPLATPVGYAGALASNTISRRTLGAWFERVVFSAQAAALPFDARDLRTRCVPLTEDNFMPALLGSCAIPFALKAVHDIPLAPAGAYWDGGITDYHLHLNWTAPGQGADRALVLYPHFQQAVVPGWLDKWLRWRHGSSPFLDHTVVLAPNPAWLRTLPGGKWPDRSDFATYARDPGQRMRLWQGAVAASAQLADEFAHWLAQPDLSKVQPL